MIEFAYFVPDGTYGPYFIPEYLKEDGTYTDDTWPASAVLMTEDETVTYWRQSPPDDKQIGVVNGRPAWVDLPPLTKEQRLGQLEQKKADVLAMAASKITIWQTKLFMKRDLSIEENAQLNAWIDYIDMLESIDISDNEDGELPSPPTFQNKANC